MGRAIPQADEHATMISASTALLAVITSPTRKRIDLWEITPKGLPKLYWTSCSYAVSYNGQTYQPVIIERGKLKRTIGLDTDTLDMTVYPGNPESTINGIPFRQAAQRGVLDGADVVLHWGYALAWNIPLTLAGVIEKRFVGNAGNIDVGDISVAFTVNSPLKRLDMPVPAKVYGAPCRWTLGDAGCGVNRTSYAKTATVGAGSTDKIILAALPSMPMGWAGGTLTILTGEDTNISRTIQTYANGQITLATPLPWAPAAGDSVTAYPGCDKVHWEGGGVSCVAYGNALFFGGQPFIPAPQTAWSA